MSIENDIRRIADRYRILPEGRDNFCFILVLICFRALSVKIRKEINNWMNLNGHSDFDYMSLSDEEASSLKKDIINRIGFFIYPSQLYDNLHNSNHKDILGEIASVFNCIQNPSFEGGIVCNIARKLKKYSQDPIMTVSWNEQSYRNQKIHELMIFIGNLPIEFFHEENNHPQYNLSKIDVDIFDSCISLCGRGGLEYYLPPKMAELLVHLVSTDKQNARKIYIPFCGYGTLISQFSKVQMCNFQHLSFLGTDKNQDTLNICWLNLVINNFNLNQFTLKESNPLEGGCLTDSDKFDIIITSYTKDLSIVDHILKHLERDSVAALLTFPRVLFRSGRDKEIRERLIAKNLISAIIQLPSNSLSGTGIAPCIIVLSNKHQDKKGIHFIDTSRDPQKEFNTHKADAYYQCIADVYSNRDNIPHFSKFVSQEEIIENEGSLKVSTYIQPYSPIENHGSQNVINDWSRTYKFNNSTLTIRFGDVVTSDAEVIVSSDDTEISMGGGVSQSILEAGGDFVREDAQKKLPALLGDVIVSTAGKLAKQKYIFHCLTIDYNHNMDFYKSKLSGRMTMNEYIARHCVGECLRLMQALNLTSIAFPLIGTGIAGIDMNMVAKIMSEALAEHISHTNMPYQIELYLMDRFGKKEKFDYQRVIESFSIQEKLIERDNINKYEEEDDSSSEPFLPNMNEDYPVFISFSDKDWDIVKKQILQVLNKEGIECFAYKKENYAGSRYKREIMDAIEKAHIVIFVSTKNSNKSREVEKEIGNSDRLGKKIIPVRFDDTPYSKDLAYDLNLIDYIDMNRMPNATQKLIEKVKFEIKRRPPLKE